MTTALVYTDTYLPPSETFTYHLHKNMKQHEVVFIAHESQNEAQFLREEMPLVIVPRPQNSKIIKAAYFLKNKFLHQIESSDLISATQLKVSVEKHSIDILVAHFCNNGIKLMAASKVLNLPLVVVAHGCDITSWCRFPRYKRNLNKLFQTAKALVTNTPYMKDLLISLGCPVEKIHICSLAPPKNVRAIAESKKSQKNEAEITLLHSGRLVPKKGILHTIRAFYSAQKKVPKLRLRIIGDGPLKEAAEALCNQLDIAKIVTFLGATEHATTIQEIIDSDIFILHSVTDENGDTEGGTTITIPEAMAVGRPVISTIHADIPYLVKDQFNGFLTKERDEESTAEAIIKLANDSQLRESMGKAAQQTLIDLDFNIEAAAKRFDRILSSILAKKDQQ